MKIKTHLYICILALAAVALLGTPMVAMATHPDVPLLGYGATPSAAGGAVPYSPKNSCSRNDACHMVTGLTTTMVYNSVTYSGQQLADMHNYGSGVKMSTHVQGVLDHAGNVNYQAYQNRSFDHGVSVGRHMNEGRNEDYSNADRAAVGDPFFTSSLGMWGKY